MAVVLFFSSFCPPYEANCFLTVNHTSLELLQNLYVCKSECWNHVFVSLSIVPLHRHIEIHAVLMWEVVQIISCRILGYMLPLPSPMVSTLTSSSTRYSCPEHERSEV